MQTVDTDGDGIGDKCLLPKYDPLDELHMNLGGADFLILPDSGAADDDENEFKWKPLYPNPLDNAVKPYDEHFTIFW